MYPGGAWLFPERADPWSLIVPQKSRASLRPCPIASLSSASENPLTLLWKEAVITSWEARERDPYLTAVTGSRNVRARSAS